MGNFLTIPKKPATEITTGFHLKIRGELARVSKIEDVDEGRRRLEAWNAYVTKHEQQVELQAAIRWCELRIGALLGKGEKGQPGQKASKSIAIELEKSSKTQFRQLYEYEELVAKMILAGTVSRSALLSEIRKIKKRAELKRKRKKRAAARAEAGEEPGLLTPNDNWQLICGDAVDELAKLEEACAALVFADPPYNIGIDYGDGGKADSLTDEAYVYWATLWLQECYRVLADDGSLWVMVGDEYAGEYAVGLKEIGFTIRNWIKWYEAFGVNCQNKFNRCSRHLFYCVKSEDDFVFNRAAVSRPSDRQAIYKDKRANHHGKLWDDVWLIPRLTGTSKERIPDFPTQLPLELLRAVVGCSSNPGDLVIDPFNGSGTTGVACLEMERRYFGIDKSELWLNQASDRLAAITPASGAA